MHFQLLAASIRMGAQVGLPDFGQRIILQRPEDSLLLTGIGKTTKRNITLDQIEMRRRIIRIDGQ